MFAVPGIKAEERIQVMPLAVVKYFQGVVPCRPAPASFPVLKPRGFVQFTEYFMQAPAKRPAIDIKRF